MEYIFALFPLLFFSSPVSPPLLSSRPSFSRFAASFGRTQRSLGSKWKRASKELCTRFRHVRYSCVLLYRVTFFLRGFHGSRERNTGGGGEGLVPLTPRHRPSDVCRLNSFFFHFLLLSSIFPLHSFFPFSFFYFPFFPSVGSLFAIVRCTTRVCFRFSFVFFCFLPLFVVAALFATIIETSPRVKS